MLVDATVVADLEAGRIEETDARTLAKAGAHIGAQRQQGAGYPLDKPPIADQAWKSTLPLSVYLLQIVGFEVAVGGLMEANQNRHDFAEAQTPRAMALSQSISQQLLLPDRFKLLAEIIDGAQQVF